MSRDVLRAKPADILASMDSGGPFTSRDDPDEPEGTDDTPLRGWIPPDDRLWRHPSEAASGGPAGPSATGTRRERHTALAAGAVGAVAVVVAMAAAFALTGSDSTGRLSVTVTSLTTSSTAGSLVGGSAPAGGSSSSPDVVAMVANLRPSLVAVVPDHDGSTSSSTSTSTTLTGVVLPGGTLVVTAASAVVGMHDVVVVTSDGVRHNGTVAGTDERSGVAVVVVADALAPASFATDEIATGAPVIAACLCAEASHADVATAAPSVSVGVVRQSGQPVELSDGTELVDAIEASTPLDPGSWGSVLLDTQGRVAGILDSQSQSSGATLGVFVPASLAVAVADALAGGHDMVHGWLGIVCTDQSTSAPTGPEVTTVFAGGPAATAGVQTGDVVEAVDGHPVATIAELQERLYTLPPGTTAQLTLARGTTTVSVPVTLSAEPA
jgi:S1-C subfamily serine protease